GALLLVTLVGCAAAKNPGEPDSGTVGPDTCDGLPCDAVYVSMAGSDIAMGSKEAPVQTLATAILRASSSSPKKAVFVRFGVYKESISMAAGVGIYGGFDEGWKRNPAVTTEISGMSPVVTFDSIEVATPLDGVTVRSADATGMGGSSYAVVVKSSRNIELKGVTIIAGAGTAGANGIDGVDGMAAGANGPQGEPGCEQDSGSCSKCPNGSLGGAGGFSFCGRTGGNGGNSGLGVNTGQPGTAGVGGAPGGGGGPSGQNGVNGTAGAAGAVGAAGVGGGSVGMFSGGMYMPANG